MKVQTGCRPVEPSMWVAGLDATPFTWPSAAERSLGWMGFDQALSKARERARDEGVEVHWISGDVSELGRLGLQPGYALVYDFGCIHGLPDSARGGVFAGLTELAAPGATLLLMAFKRGRRVILPRGMDQEEIARLSGDAWELVQVMPAGQAELANMPAPRRRAGPTMYRLRRKNSAPPAASS